MSTLRPRSASAPIALLFWLSAALPAARAAPDAAGSRTLRDHLDSVPAELASPWTTGARPWVLAGAGATAALFLLKDRLDGFRDSLEDRQPLHPVSHVGNQAGTGLPNALYAGAMLAHWYFWREERSLDRSLLMVKLSLYARAADKLLKPVFHERRPDGSSNRSFPSGHTTNAFAFASFVAAEHEWPYGAAALALAAMTAIARIDGDNHYFHDVVGGATVGTAFGLGVSLLHARGRERSGARESDAQVDLWPIFSADAKGLLVSARF